MELTELQLDWLRELFQKQAAAQTDLKDPNHPGWREYDHLQTLAHPRNASRT